MVLKEMYKQELLDSIPVVKGMDININSIGDLSVEINAPLTTHINYEGTAFGGSLNTVAVLSCYLLVHHILRSRKIAFSSLVIQDSTIRYLHPVDSDFSATAEVTKQTADALCSMILKGGRGRITVASAITALGGHGRGVFGLAKPNVEFSGRFVVRV